MNNRKQIIIILCGIVLAILLVASTLSTNQSQTDVAPASQKKPKQNAPALFESLF